MAKNTTAVATQNQGGALAPVDLSQYLAIQTPTAELKEVLIDNVGPGELSIFDLTRLRVPAGGGIAWEVETLEGIGSQSVIQAVVVGWKDTRSYWALGLDEGGGKAPPDCSSNDLEEGIGNPGGSCHQCPLNVFGSATKGDGKACKEQRILYLLQEDSLIPSVMIVPPTSLRALRQYFLRLGSRSARYYSVMTAFALAKETSGGGITYSKIVPTATGRISPEQLEQVAKYVQMLKTLVVARTTVQAPPDNSIDVPSQPPDGNSEEVL